MTRYINADALNKEFIDFIRASNNSGITPNWNDAVSLVGSAPTVDAVQVVRCVDCKHYLDGGCGNVDSQSPSKKLMGVKPDWYCADGERRENDGND